jgi:hypothetical protein
MNLNDPRFDAIFADHKFNIDPSDQNFKKTKVMETLLDEKVKRKMSGVNNVDAEESEPKQATKDSSSSSYNLLVKSIKSKTEVLKRKREENSNKKNKILKNF